jgi:hypothetical protein
VQHRAPFHDHVEHVIASDGGLTVKCAIAGAERLGCALTQLELVEEDRAVLTLDQLDARAERICKRITYLLEPLGKIEVDALAKSALVRSARPKKQGETISYYELLASADRHTTLRRYCYDAHRRSRSAVDFSLTNDQLEMLLEDLVTLTAN